MHTAHKQNKQTNSEVLITFNAPLFNLIHWPIFKGLFVTVRERSVVISITGTLDIEEPYRPLRPDLILAISLFKCCYFIVRMVLFCCLNVVIITIVVYHIIIVVIIIVRSILIYKIINTYYYYD